MAENTPKLSLGEKVCWTVMVLGFVMAALPFVAEELLKEAIGEGRFAMVLIGLVMGPTGFWCTFLFKRMRKLREALADERKLLAHWSYDRAEWSRYANEDFEREKTMKWNLFRIMAVICVVIGGIFLFADPEGGGPWVAGVLAGLLLIIVVVIKLTTKSQRDKRLAGAAELRLGEDGLLLGQELHMWKGFGARFEGCGLVEGNPPCIEFIYSTRAKNQRQINSVRVPVPPDKDAEAARLVAKFQLKVEKGEV